MNKDITLKQLISRTKDINSKFPLDLGKKDRFIDLVEEVGELAQSILITSGSKRTNDPNKQKTIEDVKDALSDVLYNVIMLAEDHEIKLDDEYSLMLDRLEKRIQKGEFTNE